MPDAEISASTAPEKVVKTRSDGSFTLQVKEHTGTFTLTVKKTGYAPVTISIDTKKTKHTVAVIQLAKVYTTTVRGKVITPARAADSAKGRVITTARVWSSIDPDNKVLVNTTDGSYSLQVASHTGNFTITAEYTATGDKNYKTSDPKTVSTTGAEINNQDIALKYGYTTEFTVRVNLSATPSSGTSTWGSGVRVVITAENGHKVGEGLTSGVVSPNGAVITVDHPGRIRATASFSGYVGSGGSETTSITTTARTQSAQTLYLYLSP